MKNLEHIIDHAEKHCFKQGLRLTLKRKHVLTSLLSSNRALSAYELADLCKLDHGQTLPPMSVYRILDFLVEEGFAHKLELANKYVACEHIDCAHAHATPQFLICRRCNRVKEISISRTTIDQLQASAKAAGFEVISPQLEMSCLCEGCIDTSQ